MDQRICIKFCYKDGLKCSSLWKTRVYEWYKHFQEDREDVDDNECPGQTSTSRTNENTGS